MDYNKVISKQNTFELFKRYDSRIVISLGLKKESDIKYSWYEFYFYKSQGYPSFIEMKEAIIDKINSMIDKKILEGFIWKDIPVWLPIEKQFNYKATYDLAVQGTFKPLTFKLGEDKRTKNSIYYTFETIEEYKDFYTSMIDYIINCLNEGWELKDNINFDDYKEFFPIRQIKK